MTSTTPRTLCAALPHATPGDTVRLQGWVHRRRELAALTFLVVRDRTGLAQVVVKDSAIEVPPEETTVEVVGTLTANAAAPGGVEVTDPQVRAAHRAGRDPAGRALATHAQHRRCRRCSTMPRSPGGTRRSGRRGSSPRPPCAASARRSTDWASPRSRPRSSSASATESGANVFEVDYFGRPAYLAQSPQFYKQTDGRRLRARLRGRAGVPGRAARHRAAPRGVRLARRGARLHRGPPRRARGLAAGPRRHGRRGARARRWRGRAAVRVGARWCPSRSRSCTSPRRSRWSVRPPTSRTWRPSTSGRWARGRWREHGSDFVAVEGYPMRSGRSTRTRSPRTRSGPTASTCCSAGWSWSPAGSGCTGPSDYDAAIRARGEDPADYAAYLQAFRHGMPPHGGFAIGLERWVARLVEAANIREVTLFPRDLTRLTP